MNCVHALLILKLIFNLLYVINIYAKFVCIICFFCCMSGVTHNIPLLRDILTEENFIKGNISTNYLPQIYPDGFKGKQLSSTEKVY